VVEASDTLEHELVCCPFEDCTSLGWHTRISACLPDPLAVTCLTKYWSTDDYDEYLVTSSPQAFSALGALIVGTGACSATVILQ